MPKNQQNRSGSNSKDYTPRKLGWFDTLWKYRWPIAAVVTAVGVGLAITVATSGVGALVVAPVAAIAVAHYAPATVAAITLAAVGGAGLLGFGVNRAVKLSKSKSLGNDGEFTWKGFFKELLGTDEKTTNLVKIAKQEGLNNSKILQKIIDKDGENKDSKERKIYRDEDADKIRIKDPKYRSVIVKDYRRLERELGQNNGRAGS